MSSSYNKVIQKGNITRDPELKYLPSGTAVAEFGIATNHKYKGKDGEMKEDVCFVDCNCYGNSAETLSKHIRKGDPLLIEGRLTLDTWEANGYKHSKHRVFVENFTFVGKSGTDERDEPRQSQMEQPQSEPDNDLPF